MKSDWQRKQCSSHIWLAAWLNIFYNVYQVKFQKIELLCLYARSNTTRILGTCVSLFHCYLTTVFFAWNRIWASKKATESMSSMLFVSCPLRWSHQRVWVHNIGPKVLPPRIRIQPFPFTALVRGYIFQFGRTQLGLQQLQGLFTVCMLTALTALTLRTCYGACREMFYSNSTVGCIYVLSTRATASKRFYKQIFCWPRRCGGRGGL